MKNRWECGGELGSLDRRRFLLTTGCAGAGLALVGWPSFADDPAGPRPAEAKHITFVEETARVLGAPCANAPFGGAFYESLPTTQPGVGTRAMFDRDKVWGLGEEITVLFLNGQRSPWVQRVQQRVRELAPTWGDYANVHFRFVDSGPCDLSINFLPFYDNLGNYYGYGLFNSHLGTDCRRYLGSTQSMNLMFDPQMQYYPQEYVESEFQRLILHEFGHALALIHEHQRPDRPITWNRQVLYAWAYRLYRWKPQTVDEQIIATYVGNNLAGTSFDARSIMMYQYTTENGTPLAYYNDGTPFMTQNNTRLTALDKVAAAVTYPRQAPVIAEEPLTPGDEPAEGTIGEVGQVARYRIGPIPAGEYTIETGGEMPALIALLRQRNNPADRGSFANILSAAETIEGQAGTKLTVSLAADQTRFIEVRHQIPTRGTGKFTIVARQGA